jgi:alanine racemase
MARADDAMLSELRARGITLAVYADDDPRRLSRLSTNGGPVAVQAYIDTGMSRMGIAYHRALPWLREARGRAAVPAYGARS